MKRVILSLALITCAAAAHAQSPSDRALVDTADEVSARALVDTADEVSLERPTFSAYADVSVMTGSFGRGNASRVSYGFGVRGGIALVEMHRGAFTGTASTNEQAYLAGFSVPLSRKMSFELLCGVSVMNGYAEGALLNTVYISDFEYVLTQFITLGYGSKDRWRRLYEHHALGTGPAMRLVMTGIVWNVMRFGLSFDARTEFKPNTTHIAVGLSMQLGSF